jgi:hypothetical protein
VIATISATILVFTGISAGIVLAVTSSTNGAGIVTAATIYNMLGPIKWGSGVLTSLLGFGIISSTSSRTRVPMLTVWIVLIILHTCLVLAYGLLIIRDFSQIYLLHDDLLQGILSDTVADMKPESEKLHEVLSPGGKLFDAFQQGSASLVLHYAPYPLNFVFFLGLRLDIAGMLFVALPMFFMLMTIPFILAIRKYFASEREGVIRHREPYENVPLSRFMCTDPPTRNGEIKAGGDYDSEEEDLASTFDGDYSGREESDYYENDDRSDGSQESLPLIR